MSSHQSGATNSASLRPRNRRLISIEDDFNSSSRNASPARSDGVASTTSSLPTTRAPSPLPSAHPSRATSTQRRPAQEPRNASKAWGFQAPSTITSNPLFTPGYWETSWSSIQGIASTLLGSDINDAQGSGRASRKKSSAKNKSQFMIPTPEAWGPAGGAEQSLAYGSQEDRLARVQAKKRETLLLANGHATPDIIGNHKRRNSISESAPITPKEEQAEIRVYIHRVQKGDTLAGISIRYNCPQGVIQKTNRMWPNDSIQIRELIYLPVDSCGIRSRKIPTPRASVDTLLTTTQEESTSTPTQSSADWTVPKTPTAASYTTTSHSTKQLILASDGSQEDSTPHIHDSWISVDHIPNHVEVARLPQRSIGFFPPARRKSVTYTDTTPPHSPARSSTTHSPTQRGRHLSPAMRPHRSTSSASASAAHFLKQLRGPGGVGTLDVTSRAPGPPRDKLNEMFAAHLPNLTAPRSSFESITSSSSTATGLGELGGKVEGWMRKMATKKGGKTNTEGDLIELVENWDLGGPESTPTEDPGIDVGGASDRRDASLSAREEEERLLSERFPMRGRVFEQSKR